MSDSNKKQQTPISESLQQVTAELGRVPQMSEFVERTRWEYRDIEPEFETWADAVRVAGIDYHGSLLAELESVAEAIGSVPDPEDMREHGCYSSGIYGAEFGSWELAVEAMDFRLSSAEDKRTENQPTDSSNSSVRLSNEADTDVLTSIISEFEDVEKN